MNYLSLENMPKNVNFKYGELPLNMSNIRHKLPPSRIIWSSLTCYSERQ